jgi:hypothetical protein
VFVALATAALGETTRQDRLFDGKSFKGWEGSRTWFRMEQGAIVGGSLKEAIPQNEFLCTTREYGDFVLRAKFKLIGEGTNAGIQIRSKRLPNSNEVSGYQADLGDGWWGCLYDEARRNRLVAAADPTLTAKLVKSGDWNDYLIRCEGPRIRLYINGVMTVDYTETESGIPQRGVIGLQIHAGAPSEARYKDITIEELGESGRISPDKLDNWT